VPSYKINIHLTAELAEELPEILGMAVRDYQLYLTEGLEMTESMKNDWSDYKLSNSFIADFIENQCVIGVDKRCKPKDLFNRHCAYALEQGVKAFSKGAFYSKIQIRFDKKRFSDTEYFIGIDLKPTGYFQEIANSYNNVDPF
jgi:phage/plasmid-associated DNA primase